jgi:hypothetical protein
VFRRYAVAQVLDAAMAPADGSTPAFTRTAHRHAFEYSPREGYLYVRSRAISSRCNDNFDEFPAEEIKKAYRTFVGKPVFVNHHNENHRRARGVIIDAALHEDRNPDGSPDTWAEVLMEVDAVRFPKLAKAILAGHIDRTSMGTDVAMAKCSYCGNTATSPSEYCFLPGTLITMADGTLKPIEQIAADDMVLTHDGPGRVVTPMQREYIGDVSVLYRRGYSAPLVLTHGHEVMANRAGRRDERATSDARYASVNEPQNWDWFNSEQIDVGNWVQGAYPTQVRSNSIQVAALASDLVERDGRSVLASPYTVGRRVGSVQYGKNSMPAFIDNFDEALAFVLGLFVAEGSFETARTAAGTPKTITWSLGQHEDDIVHDLNLALDKLGAGQVKVYRSTNSGGMQVRLSNAPLAALLQHLAGSGAAAKHLSGEVMLAPNEFQRAMLDAYYRGDGWDDPRGHVEVRTVSGLLSRQLIMLGARCDHIVPTWFANKKNPGGPTNRSNVSEIHHVALGRGAMAGRRMLHDGYFANKVVARSDFEYHGLVYNFEVEGQNSYVAEGVVVHNCAHIPKMKGKRIYKADARTGQKVGVLIREICSGLGFFENSLLVEEPADPTAFAWIDNGGSKVASKGQPTAKRKEAVKARREYVAYQRTTAAVRDVLQEQAAFKVAHGDHEDTQDGHFHVQLSQHDHEQMAGAANAAQMESEMGEHERKRAVDLSDPHDLQSHLMTAHGWDSGDMWRNSHPDHHPQMSEAGEDDRPLTHQDMVGAHEHEHHVEFPDDYPGSVTMDQHHFHSASLQAQAGPPGQQMSPTQDSTANAQGTCATCGRDIIHVSQGGNPAYEWQHNDASGAGLPHQAQPGGKTSSLVEAAQEKKVSEMSPADLAKFRKSQVEGKKWNARNPVHPDNVIDHWNAATPHEREVGMHWYSDAHHLTQHIANDTGHDMTTAAGLMSNYSPQTHWASNMINASTAMRKGKGIGGKGSGVFASNGQRVAADKMMGVGGHEKQHYDKVLGGPKTKDFAHLIEHGGNADPKNPRAVIDRHALSVAAGSRASDMAYSHSGLGGVKKYRQVADVYHKAAQQISEHTGQKVEAHQVQAATWLARQRLNSADTRVASRSKSASDEWNEYAGEHHPAAMGKEPGVGYIKDAPEDVQHAATMHKEGIGEETTPAASAAKGTGLHTHVPVTSPRRNTRLEGFTRQASLLVDGESFFTFATKTFPASDFGKAKSGQKCSRWGCDKPAVASREVGGKSLGACAAHKAEMTKKAYGETRAPQDVDTLREERCPVCGNDNSFDGNECQQCTYVAPPTPFRDPDVDKARQIDLRKDVVDAGQMPDTMGDPDDTTPEMQAVDPAGIGPDGSVSTGNPIDPDATVDPNAVGADGQVGPDGQVDVDVQTLGDADADQTIQPTQLGPDGQPIPAAMGDDDDPQMPTKDVIDPDDVAPDGQPFSDEMSNGQPGTPDDGVADVQCPVCGFEADAAPAVTDPSLAPTGGAVAGSICPNCGQGVLVSPMDEQAMVPPGVPA